MLSVHNVPEGTVEEFSEQEQEAKRKIKMQSFLEGYPRAIKNLKPSQTVYIVRGSRENNVYLHKVFITKAWKEKVEYLTTASFNAGTVDLKDLEKKVADEVETHPISQLMAMSRSLGSTVHKIHQAIISYTKDDIFVKDRNGNTINLSKENHVFRSLAKAMKCYEKIKKRNNFLVMDSYSPATMMSDSQLMKLHSEDPTAIGKLIK